MVLLGVPVRLPAKGLLCAPANRAMRDLPSTRAALSMLSQLPTLVVQRWVMLVSYMTLASAPGGDLKKASSIRKNSTCEGHSRSNAFSLRELSISRCAVAA